MTRENHRPQRTCLGCGERDDQNRMLRMAVQKDCLVLEPNGGRGGYLHNRTECRRLFLGKKGHYRAFRREVTRAMKEKLVQALESQDRE